MSNLIFFRLTSRLLSLDSECAPNNTRPLLYRINGNCIDWMNSNNTLLWIPCDCSSNTNYYEDDDSIFIKSSTNIFSNMELSLNTEVGIQCDYSTKQNYQDIVKLRPNFVEDWRTNKWIHLNSMYRHCIWNERAEEVIRNGSRYENCYDRVFSANIWLRREESISIFNIPEDSYHVASFKIRVNVH